MDAYHFKKEKVSGDLKETDADKGKLSLNALIKVECEVDFYSHHEDSDEKEAAVEPSGESSLGSSDEIHPGYTNSHCHNSSAIPRIPLIGMKRPSPQPEGEQPDKKIHFNSTRDLNKWRRNTGQTYTSRSGKTVAPRRQRRPHVCKHNKCHEVITDEVGDAIFAEYWALESRDRRVEFMANCVESLDIKKRRPRPLENGKECFRVCKSTLLGTLCETEGFLRWTAKTKSESCLGALINDKRGRHAPVHKLKE